MMTIIILIAACFLSKSITFSSSSSPRAYINNKNSYPHKILPRDPAVFYVNNLTAGGLVDVKYVLNCPLSSVTVQANGVRLKDWKLLLKTFPAAEPIEINIVGKILPGSQNSTFEFKIVAQVVYYGINAIITKAFIRGH